MNKCEECGAEKPCAKKYKRMKETLESIAQIAAGSEGNAAIFYGRLAKSGLEKDKQNEEPNSEE